MAFKFLIVCEPNQRLKNQRKVGTIPSTGYVDAMAFGPDGLLYSGTNGLQTMSIWDITKPQHLSKRKIWYIYRVLVILTQWLLAQMDFYIPVLDAAFKSMSIWDITKPKNQKKVWHHSRYWLPPDAMVFGSNEAFIYRYSWPSDYDAAWDVNRCLGSCWHKFQITGYHIDAMAFGSNGLCIYR